MMFIWIDISGSLMFCSILLLQIFKIVNTYAAAYIDYVLLGGLIYSNSSYSIKSAYVCSIKLFFLKSLFVLTSKIIYKPIKDHLINFYQKNSGHWTGNHVAWQRSEAQSWTTGEPHNNNQCQPVKPLVGLVSMEIQCWRLNEEKTFLLGGNQASALASNHVKY